MGLCGSSPQTKSIHKKESAVQFAEMDTNGDKALGKDEFMLYINKRADLWAMLAVNLGLGEDECKTVAVHVAFNMVASNKQKQKQQRSSGTTASPKKAQRRSICGKFDTMDKKQFHLFQSIVAEPLGQLEFFHRTVFQAFDTDNNGLLDASELDAFLETFYSADSIFKGDARLPTKEVLLQIVHDKFDVDGDGQLSFDEIHKLISGKADLTTSLAATQVQPEV